jgi:hypothetical protein
MRKFFEIYIYLPLSNMTTTVSVLATVIMGIERYIFVGHPILHKVHQSKIKWLVSATIVFSCLFNLPYFFKYKIGECNTKDYTGYGNSVYYTIFSWSKAVLTKIIPVVVLIGISQILIYHISKRSKWFVKHNTITSLESKRIKQQNRLTLLLVITFFAFMVGNLPIIFVMKGIGDKIFKEKENSAIFRQIRVVLNVLELLSFAVNFFIYVYYDRRFCQKLLSTFGIPNRMKHSTE